MLPRAPGQKDDQQEHQEDRDQFKQPQQAAFEVTNQHVHADVRAVALDIGHAHDGDDRHGGFDVVHVARQRRGEELAARHGIGGKEHQRKGRKAGDQRAEAFQREERAIQAAEEAGVFEDCGGACHGVVLCRGLVGGGDGCERPSYGFRWGASPDRGVDGAQ